MHVPDVASSDATLLTTEELAFSVSEDIISDEIKVASALARLLDPGGGVTDQSIVLAGVTQLLSRGGRTVEELRRQLNDMWPGAGINTLRIEESLETGRRAGHLVVAEGLDGKALWSLTVSGQEEIETTRKFSENMYSRVAQELSDQAREAFGTSIQPPQALSWAKLLAAALADGIRAAASTYDGAVEHSDALCLHPRDADRGVIFARIDSSVSKHDVADFLRAQAVAALDPTDPFGGELLTHVVTGFLLHAVVARRHLAEPMRHLGSFRGQRVALDTPILYRLLGPRSVADHAWVALKAAGEAGLRVVVANHSFDELRSSMKNTVDNAPILLDFTASDEELFAYGRLVDSSVISTFVAARREGLYSRWSDYEEAAEELPESLQSIGVEVRDHNNLDPDTVEQTRAALRQRLQDKGRNRGAAAVEWDANTLAMVRRWRRQRDRASKWPGGWVVTTDTHFTPAMSTIERDTDWPFAITLSQLSAMIVRCADVPPLADLTRATATFFSQEAAEAVATRFPPAVAASLARVISEGGKPVDVRVAQSLPELLDARTDSSDVLNAVMSARIKRLSGAMESENSRATALAERYRLSAEAALQRATVEREARVGADSASAIASSALSNAQSEIAELKSRHARARIVWAIAAAHLALAVFLATAGLWGPAAFLLGSLVAMYGQLRNWADTGTGSLLAALCAAAADVAALGWGAWKLF